MKPPTDTTTELFPKSISRRGFLGTVPAVGLTGGLSNAAAAEKDRVTAVPHFSARIGLQKAGWGETSLSDFLTAAGSLGYEGVELAPPWLIKDGLTLDDIDHTLAQSKTPLAPAIFVGGHEFRDPHAGKTYLGKARKLARWIISHGGKYLIYSTVGHANEKERKQVFTAYDAVADAVLDEGCVPLYHNHFKESHPLSKCYLEEDLEQLDWSRWKLCVDTGHLVLAQTDPVSFMKQWADKVRWVHCKDVRSSDIKILSQTHWNKNFTSLGTGVVDFPAILPILAEAEYNSWLVVEQDSSPDPVATSRRSIMYLKEVLRKQG